MVTQNSEIRLIQRRPIKTTGERAFPIAWLKGANVAVQLDHRHFTLYVLHTSKLDLRNGWSASKHAHSNNGLDIRGWHFSESFMDGETGDHEKLSFVHFMKPCEKGEGEIYFLKMEFGKGRYYMITIAKLIRDYLEIHGS